MCRLNYIILCHKCQSQLKRLVDILNDENSFFYIHVDNRIEINYFQEYITGKNIFFLKERVNCYWGDFSLVQATLIALKEILNSEKSGHTILISGQHFPLISKKRIRYLLERNNKTIFIECTPIEEAWPNHYKHRIQSYKIHTSDKKSDFLYIPTIFSLRPKAIIRSFKKLLCLFIKNRDWSLIKNIYKYFLYIKPPKGIKFYGGSQWWIIPTTEISDILEFINKNPDFLNFFKKTAIPDEIFFQTIIVKLKKQHLIKPSLTYTIWNKKSDPSPIVLKYENYQELSEAAKYYFFARKFDVDIDSKILNIIEANIQYEEQ